MSYPGHLLEGSYPAAEMQSVYSAAQADCTMSKKKNKYFIIKYKLRISLMLIGLKPEKKVADSTGNQMVYGSLPGVVANVLTCDIVVSKIEFQSCFAQSAGKTYYHSDFSERPSANPDVKFSQGVNNDNNVVHWWFCKKLKFDHTTKCYMDKSEFGRLKQKNILGILRYKQIP